MAFPVSASPYPSGSSNPATAYSGTFIPEIWSGKLIEKFYDSTVVGAISNTNYEGEIKAHGDKVQIRTRPSININPYQAEQQLVYERPSSGNVVLNIDKGYYFNTILDDVMEVQADINMLNIWAEDAAQQMKIEIDKEVLAYIETEIADPNAGNTAGRISNNIDLGRDAAGGDSPIAIVPDGATSGQRNVIDFIVDLGTVLDEQNIPENRFLVIPSWMAAHIKKSELRDASLAGDGTSMLRNGRLGMIDRFEVFSSNLLPTSATTVATSHYIYAGHKNGLTFATQMIKNETLRAESTFGQIMRGLQVYGRKVIDPTAIAVGVAYNAA